MASCFLSSRWGAKRPWYTRNDTNGRHFQGGHLTRSPDLLAQQLAQYGDHGGVGRVHAVIG